MTNQSNLRKMLDQGSQHNHLLSIELLGSLNNPVSASLQSSQNTADFTQKEPFDGNQTDLSGFPNVNIDDIALSGHKLDQHNTNLDK